MPIDYNVWILSVMQQMDVFLIMYPQKATAPHA